MKNTKKVTKKVVEKKEKPEVSDAVDVRAIAKAKEDGPNEYDIKEWVEAIVRAEEIRGDDEKMKHVGPALKKKADTLSKSVSSMSQLKKIANEMPEPE